MNLELELSEAIGIIKNCEPEYLGGRTSLALASGCELFMKYVTRSFLDSMDFNECKNELLRRGEQFASMSLSSRVKVADIGHSFVQVSQSLKFYFRSRLHTTLC